MREISTKINYNYKWDSPGQNTQENKSMSLCSALQLEQGYGPRSHIISRSINGREFKLHTVNLPPRKRWLRNIFKNIKEF